MLGLPRSLLSMVLAGATAVSAMAVANDRLHVGPLHVRVHDGVTQQRSGVRMTHLEGGVAGTAECPLVLLADSGQSVDEGTLVPSAFMNSATLAGGRIAFFAMIDGSARNQGVFRAEGGIATPVAIGCGSGGGSGDPGSGVGDPTPIGGTFTGFFGGTFFAPAINALGDVLFMADLHGGSSPRGLFVGHLNGTIDNVARVGGPAPGGGTFVNVGHGSINDAGTVAFVGRASVDTGPGIFTWTNGTLQKIARPGSPAPGGGTYTIIVGETLGFSDGTNIPVGPLPDINNLGTIAFRTLASGSVSRGIVLRTSAGVATWAVKANTATPIGGTFFDMQGASLNDAGELCFFADVNISGTFTSGLFAGLPNQLHKALAFYDEFDGGTVTGLAFSRNPMQFIDADGNVVAWCNVDLPGGVSHGRIVTIDPAGLIVTRAEQGDPSANGGTIGSIDAWPSAQSGFGVTLSTGTPGAPSGQSAHQLVPACAACVGDLTNDGEVDAEDLATLLGAWSTAGPGDLDASGTVNAADLAVLLGAWGNCG